MADPLFLRGLAEDAVKVGGGGVSRNGSLQWRQREAAAAAAAAPKFKVTLKMQQEEDEGPFLGAAACNYTFPFPRKSSLFKKCLLLRRRLSQENNKRNDDDDASGECRVHKGEANFLGQSGKGAKRIT